MPNQIFLKEVKEPYKNIEIQEQKDYIKLILSCLNTRDKSIILSRYGFNQKELTLNELAKKLKMTKEGARINQKRILKKLKTFIMVNRLDQLGIDLIA